jgi:arginase
MSFLTRTTRRLLHTTRSSLLADEKSRIKRQIHEVGAIIPPNEFTFTASPKTVEIIGAPMTAGQPLLGTDSGPQLIRSLGLSGRLATLGWRVSDADDLEFPSPGANDPQLAAGDGNAKNSTAVGNGNKILADAIQEANALGRFPLVVGGDHSVAFASVAAALRHNPDTSILWVDAHADINTPLTSPSGNMHGMPLGFFLGEPGFESGKVPGFEWMEDLYGALSPDKLVYVGLRDVDAGEVEMLRRLNVPSYTMSHVDRFGIGKLMDIVLDKLGDSPIHMSFDIDSVDPVEAPSTGTIVRGGLSYREAHYVCEAVSESGRLASMDIVEVNPMLSRGAGAEATADLAMALTESAMGSRIL